MNYPLSNCPDLCKVALVGLEWDVIDLIESISALKMFGFFDIFPQDPPGLVYLGTDEAWEGVQKKEPFLKIILTFDAPYLRARLFDYYGEASLFTLIAPSAYISSRASVGAGSIIQRGVTIMPHVKLGKSCKINVNATLHHEAVIGNFCTLAPGSSILGRVTIEDEVFVGAGAIIRPRCRIGKGATIGAGAVVVKDVPPGITVVGVPAKELQTKVLV